MRIPAFLIVLLTAVAVIHWYLWRRLVRDTTRTRRSRRIGAAAVVGAALLPVVALFAGRSLPIAGQRVLVWPAYVWLALMMYLLVALLAVEPVRLLARHWGRLRALAGARAPGGTRTRNTRTRDTQTGGGTQTRGGSQTGGGTQIQGGTWTHGDTRTLGGAWDSETGPSPADAAATPTGKAADGSGPGSTAVLTDDPPAAGGAGQGGDADPGRRLLIARSLAIVAGLAAAGTTAAGTAIALGPPRRKRVTIPLAKLPRRMDGLRIALVSDIHLGPILGRAHTQRVVDTINSYDADLVAVVGDLVDGSVAELGAAAHPLTGLRSRRGAYFVTGNHEYYSGYQEWIDEIDSLGVTVLRNERVEIDGLDLAGVNDATAGQFDDAPDYDAALGDRDTSRPAILLAHQPIQAEEAAKHGADLQLSGHTHGGQLWPFGLVVAAAQPIISGFGQVDGMPVYVTSGAGFWGPPVRIGAPPEVVLVELRSA